jgi:hypothetical protein
MGRGILKAQLRDFDQIGQRADRETQPRRFPHESREEFLIFVLGDESGG